MSAISATFGEIDRDVAVTGALLHDLGKLDTYEIVGDVIGMTDKGRLYGEISLGSTECAARPRRSTSSPTSSRRRWRTSS